MATGGLLAIYAHPDDETFGVGGTMARYAERGVPVTMVCATRGEVGEIAPGTDATPETLGQYREQELRDSMAILGVHDVRFLDYRDSGMRGTPENEDPRNLHNADGAKVVAELVRVIRERRPEVIATWDVSGGYGHPDHVAVHHHATAAFHAAADASSHPDAGAPWSGAKLFYTAFPVEEFARLMQQMRDRGIELPGFSEDAQEADEFVRVPANCIIDVSEYYDRKIAAMLAHKTQITAEDPFMRLPEDMKRDFFGREYFHRADPALADGVVITDFMQDA
jgi:N-acetyl-1-D-myo-inositol-2-amino-2-deoxy-alpha-D-glucopyranoside deacetylase